jgi:hypothetical protein
MPSGGGAGWITNKSAGCVQIAGILSPAIGSGCANILAAR